MIDRRTLCGMACASLLPAARAQTVWKLATGYRAESFHGENLQQFAADAAAGPGGLRIELHPNNSLFKLNEIAPAVRAGKLEAGETIMASLVKDMPVAGADAVPFIVRSYADARRMWRHQRPVIEAKFAAAGLKVLYAVAWPPQGLYTQKPIARAADLRGGRMRTYNRTTERIAELMGASAVDVPMVEVGKALADGRIDSMITSAVTGVENRVWDHVRHYYEINAWFPKNIVFAGETAFKALPAPAQRSLMNAAEAAEARGWAASERAAVTSVDELRRRGLKVEPIPPDLLTDVKRLGERFSLEWVREVGADANYIFVPYFTQQ
ncbi:TRAP transporter substrate-binding protein [Variovorax sp. CF079]|uniref:TRAP transporter substrate-binding protein n=1 Tax=Variovorax sp. CF079 TaxID=1882774 RepID=UPI001FCCC366|nr:TRAP transporter substrate-binding protein [Variovorax sp. CF079]